MGSVILAFSYSPKTVGQPLRKHWVKFMKGSLLLASVFLAVHILSVNVHIFMWNYKIVLREWYLTTFKSISYQLGDKMEKFVWMIGVDAWSRKKAVISVKSLLSHKWSWERWILDCVCFKWDTAVWVQDIDQNAASSLCSQGNTVENPISLGEVCYMWSREFFPLYVFSLNSTDETKWEKCIPATLGN